MTAATFKNRLNDIWQRIDQQAQLKLMINVMQRFIVLDHKTHAAALTYTTLFALVPLLTVTYSVLSVIPSLQESRGDIEQLLMGNLVPSSGNAVKEYLYQFSQQAQKLTVVGVVFLAITAFMMLRSIEDTFNKIWRLKRGRRGVSGFLLYWAILSLGPLILSAGLGVSSYISSLELWDENWVPTSGTLALAIIVPYFSSFLAFTLIYWAVPNCQVLLKHAAIGGGIVALLFEIGQEFFAAATTYFPSYQLIYGAFAAVPLFLLWLYISWTVILLGANIVYVLGREVIDEEDGSVLEHKKLGLNILALLQQAQCHGEGLCIAALQQKLHGYVQSNPLLESHEYPAHGALMISQTRTKKALDHLMHLKMLVIKDECYFLIRNLTNYSLHDYFQDIRLEQWPLFCAAYRMPALVDEEKLAQSIAQQSKNIERAWSLPIQQFLLLKDDSSNL